MAGHHFIQYILSFKFRWPISLDTDRVKISTILKEKKKTCKAHHICISNFALEMKQTVAPPMSSYR